MHTNILKAVSFLAVSVVCLHAGEQSPPRDEVIALLRKQVAAQRLQIEEMRQALEKQDAMLARLAGESGASSSVAAADGSASSAGPVEHPVMAQSSKPEASDERPKATLGGFELSGDFRFRADVQARSGNEVAGPLQNIRSRYRVRLNVDKELDPRFKFHLQLSTGPYQNPITDDQDMAGGAARHPFSINEAWLDFQPNEMIGIRGGRMREVFADNSRFLWDDDVRLNGFQQTLKLKLPRNSAGFTGLEVRAGEYILSNPAVYVLSPTSPYISAGYRAGQKVRSSNLFHPGVILSGGVTEQWTQEITGDVQVFRNPNQIQLSSTSAGFPVLINSALGLQLSGPVPGTGNATTEPGGAMYSAPDFHIARLAYRLNRKPFSLLGRKMPAFLDFQVARNFGANTLRDAFMVTGSAGSVEKAGDLRFLYQFAIKDANSMISQLTDDNLGTSSGVNIAAHGMRVDVGLARFLQLQNLLFVINPRRASNPAEQMFVPLQRGANTTFRYLGQLAFTF